MNEARLGVKSRIPREDQMRLPRIKLLVGDDPWVSHIDNGIKCSWNVTKCMFSSGNGTEKKRVAEMNSRSVPLDFLFFLYSKSFWLLSTETKLL